MKVNSRFEQNKLILPFVIGLLIAILIYPIWLFIYMQGEGDFDSEYAIIMLPLILLVVEVSIGIIEIVLVYRARVVKMSPKSSYDIGNINDYIMLQEHFRNGNYEYETIRSKEDIFRAYEVGKKIVFTAHKSGERLLIWIGIIFSILGFIISLIVVFNLVMVFRFEDVSFYIITFTITNALCTGIGAAFFVPNFLRYKRLPRSFFILAPEGVVYRRIWGGVKSYSWKELDLKVYSVTTTMSLSGFLKTELPPTVEIHIILPNGSRLKFKPDYYNLSKFLTLKKFKEKLKERSKTERIKRYRIASLVLETKNFVIALVATAFKHYFDVAKGEYETNSEIVPPKTNKKIVSKIFQKRKLEKSLSKDQIFLYLKRNSGKAFTVQSLLNRINDLKLSENVKNNIDLNTLEQILDDLSVNGKITRQDKEGKSFFFF